MHPRVIALTMGAVALLAFSACAESSASADGYGGISNSCSTAQATCSLKVTELYRSSSPAPQRTTPSKPASSAQLAAQRWLASCRVDYHPAVAKTPVHSSGPGSWYLAACARLLGLKGQVPAGTPLMWVPGAARAASVLQAALTAEALLKLPKPALMSSPGPAAEVPKVVNLPTWAWVPAADFVPLSATASLPGVSATVTATPYAVNWVWGDGSRSRCTSPGTPYPAGTKSPASRSPDCGHTYRTTSADAPGERFAVSATTVWHVRWAGAGQSGTLPDLVSSAGAAWPVEQIQSVIVN